MTRSVRLMASAATVIAASALAAFATIDTPPALEFVGVITAVLVLSAGLALLFQRYPREVPTT